MINRLLALLIASIVSTSVFAADRATISAALLRDLPRSTVRVSTHESKTEADYEGVAVGDVVRKMGAPAGEAIRGKKVSLIVVVKAADGYQAVFALAELDPKFTKKVVLLADRREGKPLDANEGPYRLVVPDEGRQARWVRQVVSIEIRAVK